MLNMLPKLELVPIMMYFIMLPKVRRPSISPSESPSSHAPGGSFRPPPWLRRRHYRRKCRYPQNGVKAHHLCHLQDILLSPAVSGENDPVFLDRSHTAKQVNAFHLRHQGLIIHLSDLRSVSIRCLGSPNCRKYVP